MGERSARELARILALGGSSLLARRGPSLGGVDNKEGSVYSVSWLTNLL